MTLGASSASYTASVFPRKDADGSVRLTGRHTSPSPLRPSFASLISAERESVPFSRSSVARQVARCVYLQDRPVSHKAQSENTAIDGSVTEAARSACAVPGLHWK